MTRRRAIRSVLAGLIGRSPLQHWPVTVRAGLAKGARWTAFPFSANWRLGGEVDVARCVAMAGDLAGRTCWDLGAHFGIHTVGLAMCVGPTGEVAAFEPDPVAHRKLERHVRMNRLDQVKLFQAAASDAEGFLELIVAGALGSTVTHARYDDEVIGESTDTVASRAIRLDSLVDEGAIRLPDFVKIDVEGHGAKAIAGAIRAVSRSRPLIALSVHSRAEWFDTATLLEAVGYMPYALATGNVIDWSAFPGPCTVALRVPR